MTFSAETYLLQVLPALIRSRDAPGPLPTAVIQWLVTDGDAVEVHYALSPDAGLEVRAGLSDRQDLTLAFLREDLEAFAEGRLDFETALTTRRLKVHGQTELMSWLADHLAH